jgi:hypothetical protein
MVHIIIFAGSEIFKKELFEFLMYDLIPLNFLLYESLIFKMINYRPIEELILANIGFVFVIKMSDFLGLRLDIFFNLFNWKNLVFYL